MTLRDALGAIGREGWWWVSGLGGLLRNHLGRTLALGGILAVLYGTDRLLGTSLAVCATGGLVASVFMLALWNRVSPRTYVKCVAGPLWRRRKRKYVHRAWDSVMDGAGLSREVAGSDPQRPVLDGVRWADDGHLWVCPRLLIGQTVEDVENVSDRLRTAVGARLIRVVPNDSRTRCQLMLVFLDHLEEPFPAQSPNPEAEVASVDEVPLGRCEVGQPWRLPLRASTLTVGCTGAGKGSVMWGLVLAQAPNIRSGLVQFHGADLKGAMELGMGRNLFTRLATTGEEAVVMLEDAAQLCRERADRLSGVTRMHQPTPQEPLVIVLIDELAVLVGYQSDRELLKRAESALSYLLVVGRAVGFYVYAYLQDPRKETVKMRHLFPQAVGLRLRQKEEIAMVLGDGAVNAGARCDRISRTMPGTGYVVTDDGAPMRVRAGFVSDSMIRLTAQLFPAPTRIPIVIPQPEAASLRGRKRSEMDSGEPDDEAKLRKRRSRKREEDAAFHLDDRMRDRSAVMRQVVDS